MRSTSDGSTAMRLWLAAAACLLIFPCALHSFSSKGSRLKIKRGTSQGANLQPAPPPPLLRGRLRHDDGDRLRPARPRDHDTSTDRATSLQRVLDALRREPLAVFQFDTIRLAVEDPGRPSTKRPKSPCGTTRPSATFRMRPAPSSQNLAVFTNLNGDA